MLRLIGGVAVVLACHATLDAQTAAGPGTEPPTIVAQGEATIALPPDRAYVQIAAEARAPKTVDAQRQAADAMAHVQATLASLGIANEAIRSSGYQLQPQYDYANGRQTFRTFLARHVLEVRIDDIATLGAVLDGVGESGATSISGMRFDLKSRSTIERDALKQAVADAMERAQSIAAGAGRTIGGILRIQEQRMSMPVPRFEMMAANRAAGATPIAPGEVEIRAQVLLTALIK